MDFTLTSNMRSNMASSTSSMGWFLWVIAALLMTMSREPNSLTLASTMFWTSARLDTSPFSASALLPISDATRLAPSSFRSAMTTLAPSRANSLAVPSPKPLPAPVISATLPSSCPILIDSLFAVEMDDGFGGAHFFERNKPFFATVTAFLDTAKGQLDATAGSKAVDVDLACLHGPGHAL